MENLIPTAVDFNTDIFSQVWIFKHVLFATSDEQPAKLASIALFGVYFIP